MDSNRIDRLSITPTVARQTPKQDFGDVMSKAVSGVVGTGQALIGALPGGAIVSAAASAVTSLANGRSTAQSSGTIPTLGGGAGTGGSALPGINTATAGIGAQAVGNGSTTGDFDQSLRQMKQQADESLMMQMKMQNESREYNAVSNVLKVRHDSAKSAINNIR